MLRFIEPHVLIAIVCGLATLLSVVSGRRLWTTGERRWSIPFALSASVASGAFWTLVFYPALMSGDSLDYWREAVDGRYGDWQPPIMALLMRAVFLASGARVAFYTLLQASCFYLAALVLIDSILRCRSSPMRGRVQICATLGFLLYPVGWVYSVTLWKDVLLAIAGCLLAASLVRFLESGRRSQAALSLAFLFLAVASRHNAMVLVPAAGALLYVGLRRAGASALRLWVTGAVLCGAIAFPAVLARVFGVRHSDRSVILASLLLGYDQTLERTEHTAHAPSEAFWDQALGAGGYRALMDRGWACGEEWTYELHPEVGRTRIRDAVRRDRSRALAIVADFVLHHPQAAALHHLCVVAKLTGWGDAAEAQPYQAELDENDMGLVAASRFPEVRLAALRGVKATYDLGLEQHRAFLSLLAAMLLVPPLLRRKWAGSPADLMGISEHALVVLPMVGLSYFGSWCLLPLAYDWRYLLLPAVLAVASICVIVAHALVSFRGA